MVNPDDFKEYDKYKDIKGSNKILKRIIKEKRMYSDIYYWDNTSNNVMIEIDLDKYNENNLNTTIDKLKQVNDIFKKGYVIKDEILNDEIFDLLQEHITASAYRYSLINKKPFILTSVKYELLDNFEIKCLFEHIIQTPTYLDAAKHKDVICYMKIGWWMLKDMIEKHKDNVRLGMADYNYECQASW